MSFGLLAAFITLLAWGFGDFFIQRAIRKIGEIPSLFFIGLTGAILIFPFIKNRLPALLVNPNALLVLLIALVITLIAALLLFKALGQGKLSIIEPVMSLELPLTVILGITFLSERPTPLQLLLLLLIFIGILLTAVQSRHKRWWQKFKKISLLEKGVILAIIGAFFTALMNVTTALGSQITEPLLTIWFIHTGLAVICLFWLGLQRRIKKTFSEAKKFWRPVAAQSFFDNIAWIAYAFAVREIPVSITIGITESYVVLSTILGISLNKERLSPKQTLGVVLTLASILMLAYIS